MVELLQQQANHLRDGECAMRRPEPRRAFSTFGVLLWGFLQVCTVSIHTGSLLMGYWAVLCGTGIGALATIAGKIS
jgi:hypothetical protein